MQVYQITVQPQNNFVGSNIYLKRETSPYNKYMKWHVEEKFNGGGGGSFYFKTKKQAEENIERRVKIIKGEISI